MAKRNIDESMWFGEGDETIAFTSIDPKEGSSVFRRIAAFHNFKAEENCQLINDRIGAKMNREGFRRVAARKLENILV